MKWSIRMNQRKRERNERERVREAEESKSTNTIHQRIHNTRTHEIPKKEENGTRNEQKQKEGECNEAE